MSHGSGKFAFLTTATMLQRQPQPRASTCTNFNRLLPPVKAKTRQQASLQPRLPKSLFHIGLMKTSPTVDLDKLVKDFSQLEQVGYVEEQTQALLQLTKVNLLRRS